MSYEAVIGLEVHVEIDTKSKVFCACKNEFHSPPNTNVCPVCLGMPGALPVLNRAMVDASMAVGLALHCTISRWSKLDRKNYFYPDLAKSYQISQYDLPLCHDGWLEIDTNSGTKRIGITRAHMEEDTARNTHELGGGVSGIDFNRAGVPLLEIVTGPDIRSADEAYAYLTQLKLILQYLGVSDCNMEEGSLRAEPNISVRPIGQEKFGTKTEVKNVASFTGVRNAIEFELKRQIRALDSGETIIQETRGWDADKGVTLAQRSKESAHDYRYFPDPDLVPIVVDEAWERRIRESLPELPRARCARFREEYALSGYDAEVLTASRAVADYFESVVRAGASAKLASNWIMGDLQSLLVDADQSIGECRVRPERLAEMIQQIENGAISGKIAKAVLPVMFETGKSATEAASELGLSQISDRGSLEDAARKVIADNPGPAADYRAGTKKALGFLVGQMMKATRGQGNPQLVNEILVELLERE